MRVLFYVRPWTVEVFVAVEALWRRRGGSPEIRYVTQHLAAHRALRGQGRDSTFLPAAVGSIEIEDPQAVLRDLEERYASHTLPFMRYLFSDRFFVRRNRAWQLRHLAAYAVLFDRLLSDFRPDLVVGESPDFGPGWLAYDMAHAHGGEPVGLMPSTIPPGRLLMLRRHNEIRGARDAYEQLRRNGLEVEQLQAARRLQDVITGAGTKLDYLTPRRDHLDFLRRLARGAVIREQATFSLGQLRERLSGNLFYEPNPIWRAAKGPARSVRARWADARALDDALPDGKFVFYPLHYEPEATTLVHGSYFENQAEVIKNLGRSLPAGWTLVVKEHFFMRGMRQLSFYGNLRRMANVRLVPFSVPTNRLILDAEVVAIISSTAGLEASLVGRPVVMFGDFPWDYAPTVHKVGALSRLPELIRDAARSGLGPDHPDVLAFAASWDGALPAASYYRHRGFDWLQADNIARIADALESRLTRPREQRSPAPVDP